MKQTMLSAFSNSVRLHLIVCLSRKKRNVAQLMKNCGLSQSAVSQHLKKLRAAGVVATKRDGKEVYYYLVFPQAARLSRSLLSLTKIK
ncbi:MAG: ArsR/SmtB family transcription factor [Minisyncoccota bacterium]